ncbi:WD40 repeat domain-containing protein, partial [Endozoicomonas sp. YOMI1]|uniref:WD40 repeat domain-containing protein n=1 Tax=Endozoicomonas sp. YOMI1 TaxID=2828739 RepID=UPI002149432E
DPQAGNIIVLRKYSNGRWVSLTQPISHYQQTGPQQPHFKATDNFLLAYCGRAATIWGFSDKGNYLVEKGVFECDGNIGSAQLSDDERHAVVFTWGSQALFLGCDDDGNWSQVGNVHHPETMISDDNQAHTNLICQAAFNASGQHALTRDIDNKVIISGYDGSGAWVRKAEIKGCAEARFSPSGHKFLARLGSGRFKLWDCKSTGERLDDGQVLEHIGSREVVFSPSENRLLSYGDDTNFACLWVNDDEGNLVEEARVFHQEGVDYAAFNPQEDSVLTCGMDLTLKIQGLDSQGKWQEQLMARHQNSILDARFSHSGRLAYSVGLDDTACILGRDANGQWLKQAVTGSDDYSIDGADLDELDSHFLTYGNKIYDQHQPGLVQLWGIDGEGNWVEKEQIKLDYPVKQARFSPDSEHLVINCNNDSDDATALLWKIPASPGQETAHT